MADSGLKASRLHTIIADGSPCPYGCMGSNGVVAAFDWAHVRYYCQRARYVAMRKAEVIMAESLLAEVVKWPAVHKVSPQLSDGFAQVARFIRRAKQGCGTNWSSFVEGISEMVANGRYNWLQSMIGHGRLPEIDESERALAGGYDWC